MQRKTTKTGAADVSLIERRLVGQLARAKRELSTFTWVLAGVLAIFGLLPFWEEPIMPATARAMVAAMSVVSLVFLGAWFVNNMLLIPARLRALRRRLSSTAP